MRKSDIVKQISEKTNYTQTDVAIIINSLMGVVKAAVSSGENVYLRNFGTFCIKRRAAKNFYATGKRKFVPEHNDVVLIISRKYREKMTKISSSNGNM